MSALPKVSKNNGFDIQMIKARVRLVPFRSNNSLLLKASISQASGGVAIPRTVQIEECLYQANKLPVQSVI